MAEFDDFDLNPTLNDSNTPQPEPRTATTYTPTTVPCLVTEIITVLSQVSTSLTGNGGWTESQC